MEAKSLHWNPSPAVGINRLQRREILHQKPVGKNVTTDFAQKDALGRVSRKPKLTAHQVEMARGLLESGKPPRDVAKAFGAGRSTLYRVLKLVDDSVMVASGAE
jgi:DNA invertase Pin-like site-specific DNA recombinase